MMLASQEPGGAGMELARSKVKHEGEECCFHAGAWFH